MPNDRNDRQVQMRFHFILFPSLMDFLLILNNDLFNHMIHLTLKHFLNPNEKIPIRTRCATTEPFFLKGTDHTAPLLNLYLLNLLQAF